MFVPDVLPPDLLPHITLPEGRHLERDPDHGYLKIMPRPSSAELEAYYAGSYRPPQVSHDPARAVDLVEQVLPQPGRILDIGCGLGDFLAAFRNRGWHALGIEPGAGNCATCRERGLEVIEGFLDDDFASRHEESFDAVLLESVLEHLADPDQMLRWIRRLIRPGGAFYCNVPNDFNALQLAKVRRDGGPAWWVAYPDHLNYFSHPSLVSLIRFHGFEPEVVTTEYPVEFFLLMGQDYTREPDLGKTIHSQRCQWEKALCDAGRKDLLNKIYAAYASLGIGRQALVVARRTA
jgi:SAM-dependent methyltransferase